jgi:hypothetical protein
MKKIIILFGFLVSINNAFSQSMDFDAMLKKIAAEKNDNARIDLINNFTAIGESNPIKDMQNSTKLLFQSQQNKDKLGEAMALAEIGYNYRSFGKTRKSLEFNLKATAIAQETGNEKLIAITKHGLAHNYKDLADYAKALRLYLSAGECEENY